MLFFAAERLRRIGLSVNSAMGNRLREIREHEGIQIPALASASGISERVITRVEGADGAPRLEIKARLVTGLNTLLGDKRYQTDDVFSGWQAHRRNRKSNKGKGGGTPA